MLSLILLSIPLVASVLLLFTRGGLSRNLALVFTVIQLGVTAYAYSVFKAEGAVPFDFLRNWSAKPFINVHFSMDGISMLMIILSNLLLPLIVLSGYNRELTRPHVFYSLMLFMQFALNGVFIAFDGFVYYIFWELALIPIYFISFTWGGENRAQVTLKFFIYTLAGSLLMLFGFLFLYNGSPAHSLDWLSLKSNPSCGCNQTWLFWLFFIAFAIKIPIVPFHTWQPDTYKTAPTQGTMLLSGIMLKMGTYSLIRWLIPIVPSGASEWQPIAIALCVAGIVYASVIAIMQRDLKKLFAYSSIAHVGLISAGILAMNLTGMQGSLIQMLSHGLTVVGLFLCADIIFNRTQNPNVEGIGGIRLVAPQFATWFMVIVLGSVALPLTSGFVGEFMLLYGVYQYNTWLSVFAGLTIILGAVYMLRMYQKVVLGKPIMENMVFPDLYWNEKVVLITLGILIFFLGVYPKPIIELTEPVLKTLTK
ncbi:MAG: NADH-quinone oxidoreductase subunit M [Bacteroidetes bacterium B1(2017)]|nr:MAG: NADH-quinone oxidoreductase subunit M [Bacteroidetes bacterium B1(2017)]